MKNRVISRLTKQEQINEALNEIANVKIANLLSRIEKKIFTELRWMKILVGGVLLIQILQAFLFVMYGFLKPV